MKKMNRENYVQLNQVRVGSILKDLNGDMYTVVSWDGPLIKMQYDNGKSDHIVESGVRYHTLVRR